jgi:hypothetical protein
VSSATPNSSPTMVGLRESAVRIRQHRHGHGVCDKVSKGRGGDAGKNQRAEIWHSRNEQEERMVSRVSAWLFLYFFAFPVPHLPSSESGTPAVEA